MVTPAFREGMDAAALSLLLQDMDWVRRLAARLVRDPASADDLAQETWVRALEHAPRGGGITRAWLGTVLRNLARERARLGIRRAEREERAARSERVFSTDELAAEVEIQERLTRLVLALEEPYRSTVLLRFVHDLEPAQIASRLRIPPATVRSRLKRALDVLRAQLDAEHGGDRSTWMHAAAALPLSTGVVGSTVPAPSLVLTGVVMKTWNWGLAAVLAIALGTLAGGERIIKTMGTKIIRISPLQGFAAETAGTLTILAASHLGVPVSTTHCINASIMGVGASNRVSAVRWGVAANIALAWVLTLPISAAIAWGLTHLLGAVLA